MEGGEEGDLCYPLPLVNIMSHESRDDLFVISEVKHSRVREKQVGKVFAVKVDVDEVLDVPVPKHFGTREERPDNGVSTISTTEIFRANVKGKRNGRGSGRGCGALVQN